MAHIWTSDNWPGPLCTQEAHEGFSHIHLSHEKKAQTGETRVYAFKSCTPPRHTPTGAEGWVVMEKDQKGRDHMKQRLSN